MIERTLPILATRKATAVRVDAFRAVPLTIGISIPDEIGSLAGATILRAEIRSSRVDLSATALAGTSIELPIGQLFELTFTSAQMNQSLAGEESAQFWLVVYATYPPGAVSGSVDLELDVFASIDLVLHEHAASLTAPSPPNAAIALTKTQADLLYMPIGGETPGTGTVTSVAVNTANGVSAVVTNPSSNVAMTFTLGAITPTSVAATGAVSGSSLSTTGNVSGTWAGTAIALAKGGTGATTASGARTALELGTMATQDAGSYLTSDWAGSANITTVGTVTTGTWSASTIALAKGGTGATTAAGARAALELGSLAQLSAAPAGTLTGSTLAAGVTASSLTSASGGSFGTGAYAAAFDPASPGPIGATAPSTVRATNFTSTTGVNSFGNTNFQDLSVFNLLGSSKANLQSALTLGAFDDAIHKGVILTGVLTITSSGSTPVFTYASGAAAIHRTALGLGTLATVSPTGTANATTYLRGDGAWAAITSSGGFVGTPNRIIIGGATTNADGSIENTLATTGVSAAINSAILAVPAAVGSTNVSLVLSPKGTGSIIFGPAPDGGASGGNQRPYGVLDLQLNRTNASRVANGIGSIVVGFNSGTTGEGGICIGTNSVATGSYAICLGYQNTSSTTSESSIAIGVLCQSSGVAATAIGRTCIATANQGVAIGSNSSVTVARGVAIGFNGLADRQGMRAWPAVKWANQGDAQCVDFTLTCKTTSTAAVEMALDGATSYLTIPSGKGMAFTASIFGIRSSDGVMAHFIRKGAIRNFGVSTQMTEATAPYGVTSIGIDANTYGCTVLIEPNDTGDYLSIKVSSPDTTIVWRWIAHVEGIETAYGT